MDGERTAWVKMSPWVTLHLFPFPPSCTCLKCAVNWHQELSIWMTAPVLCQSSCPSSLLSIFDSLVFPAAYSPLIAHVVPLFLFPPCLLIYISLSSSPVPNLFHSAALSLSLTSEVLCIVIFHYEMRHKTGRFLMNNKQYALFPLCKVFCNRKSKKWVNRRESWRWV